MKVFCYVIFCLSFLSSSSQNILSEDLRVAANVHYGLLIPEYQNHNFLVNDYIKSFTVNVSKKTSGKNEWQQLYNYPEYGLGFFYSTLGNDMVHGKEFAIYPYFSVNLISKSKFSLYKQIGFGLSYVTRKFDLRSNYLNVSVGSHINFHFNSRLGFNYNLLKSTMLNAGISFDHFSNGNMQEPNLGINYVTFFSGLTYKLGSSTAPQKIELNPHVRENYLELFYNVGGKRTRALASDFYYTTSISLQAVRRAYRGFNIGTGIDFFYDQSVKTEMQALKTSEFKKIYNFQSGIHLSLAMVYNRLTIGLQQGVYIGLIERVNNNRMYNRGLVKYRIADRVTLSLAMKSHLHILDYPELGVGFKL